MRPAFAGGKEGSCLKTGLVTFYHIHTLICRNAVTLLKQVQNNLGCGRCPHLEGGVVAINDRTEIIAVIDRVHADNPMPLEF